MKEILSIIADCLELFRFFLIRQQLSFHHWLILDITGWRRRSVTLVRQILSTATWATDMKQILGIVHYKEQLVFRFTTD